MQHEEGILSYSTSAKKITPSSRISSSNVKSNQNQEENNFKNPQVNLNDNNLLQMGDKKYNSTVTNSINGINFLYSF